MYFLGGLVAGWEVALSLIILIKLENDTVIVGVKMIEVKSQES